MSRMIQTKVATTSAWLLYTLIVLEILFMVSPFAAYYYSIYAVPLNVLQETPETAWLTRYLLPHFTYSGSLLVNLLILVSLPLILIGIVLFALAFCQIYWSKITGKGAVEVGLYRHIRHPQYVALAIIGLGATLFWSRFVVVLTFVSMIFVYYFLARFEERICLGKFGSTYKAYIDRTGMFLPKRLEVRWQALGLRLPQFGWPRVASLTGLYAGIIALTIVLCNLLRAHVIDSLQIDISESRVTVFLAPFNWQAKQRILDVLDDATLPGSIAYAAPSSWRIPELGLVGTGKHRHAGLNVFLHPTTHFNSLDFDQNRATILLASPARRDKSIQGLAVFTQALGIQLHQTLEIELLEGSVVDKRAAAVSQWQGIPVPTF